MVWDKYNPVLADPRIRRAMSHAIDRQAIVDSLWLGRTKVPKGLQWDFYGDMRVAGWDVPEFNLDTARALLKEAGYKGDPIPYQLLNNYYTNQTPTSQVLVEGWRAAGLNVQIEMKENWNQLLGRFRGRGLCDNSNSPGSTTRSPRCRPMGPAARPGKHGNGATTKPPRVLQVLQSSTDADKRHAAFARMLAICEREDPAYTVLHQNATFTAKRRDIPWRASQSFVMDFCHAIGDDREARSPPSCNQPFFTRS